MTDRLEQRIRNYLAVHLELLEPGLTLLQVEHPISSLAGAGARVDIVAKDKFGHFVIIEVKRSDSAARQALHEIHKYTALFRNTHGLDRTQIRLIVASTDWHELLVPFSECVGTFQCSVEGFAIEAAHDGTIRSATRVELHREIPGLRFSREQALYLFESQRGRDDAVATLSGAAQRIGLSDFFLIAMDYAGEHSEVQCPFGLYFVFSSPIPGMTPSELQLLQDALFWDYELDAPNENFLLALNRNFIGVPDTIEIGYPEKLSTIRHSWRTAVAHRHGRLAKPASPLTDEELMVFAQAVRGGSPIYFQKVCSPRFVAAWSLLREDVSAVLVGLPHWQALVPSLFDELEADDPNATVSVAIHNPADLITGLYTIATDRELSRCPRFEIVVERARGCDVRICSGVLAWNGQKVADTPEDMLGKVYGGIADWLITRHLGSTWELEPDALEVHQLFAIVVEFRYENGVEAEPKLVELFGSTLQRTIFKPEQCPSLAEFADAHWTYLISLKRLIDSHAHGLNTSITPGDSRTGDGK